MKLNKLLLAAVITITVLTGREVLAEGIVINPYLIDETAKAKDILEYTIKIENNNDTMANLYPVVSDITTDGGRQEFINSHLLDKTVSAASWIEIQRSAVKIKPHEKTELPLRIKVGLSATPGVRHAEIAFVQGSNKKEADEAVRTSQFPKILINLNIEDQSVEKAQLIKFQPVKKIFFEPPFSFDLQINNTGNVALEPTGNVWIYDRNGQGVAELNVNEGRTRFEGGENFTNTLTWEDGKAFGKYKARIDIEYGGKAPRNLQDTVYFWVLPWKILIVFSGLVVLLFTLTAFGRRRKVRRTGKVKIEGGSEGKKRIIVN